MAERSQDIPLGVTYRARDNETLFAVVTGLDAEPPELTFINSPEHTEAERIIRLENSSTPAWLNGTGRIWHTYVPDIPVGQLYGYRVDGPYDPKNGLRYNKHKLLLDPYAAALSRRLRWSRELYGYQFASGDDLQMCDADNIVCCPLASVVDHSSYDWGSDRAPNVAWTDTVIYETHVRGFTMTDRSVPLPYRGTYAGLVYKIPYLKRLGVTAIELMPIANSIPGSPMRQTYWRYDTIALFAPEIDYSAYQHGEARIVELKDLVKALHAAGIEVILDIVLNHTAEGNHLGPHLSLKGLHNGAYYQLCGNPESGPYRFYRQEKTGCGNTLSIENPIVLQMALDCLRSWVLNYHVDGFRFDLATVLTTLQGNHNHESQFLTEIASDPVLSKVKLIAEPWDASGHHLARFPSNWGEWNDRYRDNIRRIVRGDDSQLPLFSTSLFGSKDLFPAGIRGAARSVNFITCHDGFTLWDLVSYAWKHNEGNGESNRDGTDSNHSANYGHEGPTSDAEINTLRKQQCRNFIAILFCSRGTPMLLSGDEHLRTQHGNNNAYCQDNPQAWNKWAEVPTEFQSFVSGMAAIRRRYPALRSGTLLGSLAAETLWFREDAQVMEEADWRDNNRRTIGIRFLTPENKQGRSRLVSLYLILNTNWSHGANFELPVHPESSSRLQQILDTAEERRPFRTRYLEGASYQIRPRSLVLLRSYCEA